MEVESLHAHRPALFTGLRARFVGGSLRRTLAVLAGAALLTPALLGIPAAHAEPIDPTAPIADPANAARTPIAIVMPITVPATALGLISSDDLATYTAPTGALTRQLDAAIGHNVTLAIDPMIIASIRVLGSSAPSSASEWLDRLALVGNETFALPYADADLAAELQAGHSTLFAPTSFNFALSEDNFDEPNPLPSQAPLNEVPAPTPSPTSEEGTADTTSDAPLLPTTEELLAWPYTLSGIAWPAANTMNAATPEALAANGYHTTIVAESNLTAPEKGASSASAHTGDFALLVADTELNDAVSEAFSARRESDWQIAAARSNEVLTAAAASGSPRSLLAMLPRAWPSNPNALSATLNSIEQNPAASVVPLSALQALPATEVTVADLAEAPERLSMINALVERETELAGFSTALADPTTLMGDERLRILGLLGVAWLNDETQWRTAVGENLQRSYGILNSVSVVANNTVLVVGGSAQFPVTVENSFIEPVTLRVTLTPSNGRLVVDESAEVTVDGGSSSTVLVPVNARVGNGLVDVTVTLTTAAGVLLEDPVTIPVDVRADWEGVGAALLGTAILLFFGFGIFRNIRRQRRERAAEEAADASDPSVDSSESESVKPANEVTNPDAAEPESPRG